MAKCETGYLCEVCGRDVADISDSDLYLRFVIGEIDARELMSSPERHLCCNPTLAQFVVDPEFATVQVTGLFAKQELSPDDVARREQLVTRGWRRLQELQQMPTRPAISDYPLPEFRRSR
ncbi:MAG: hypothetical protein U0992_21020 [Planctomycetaceae bacterium]